jgi:NADH dehydrogenase
MGVEIRLNAMVTKVTAEGIHIGDEFIPVRNVFWAAGVKASPLGKSMGVPTDRAGRVIVGPDLSIPGHPEVFVAGDMASATSADTGKPVPGVAQGGIQMGRFAGETIANELRNPTYRERRKPFVLPDKGTMAIIGEIEGGRSDRQLQVRRLSGLAPVGRNSQSRFLSGFAIGCRCCSVGFGTGF